MNFTSLDFAGFVLAVYALIRSVPHRWQNLVLLLAGYIFYATWDWRYLGLLWFSTAVDYGVGLGMSRTVDDGRRRRILLISLCTQLGILAVFKYLGFFLQTAHDIASRVGLPAGVPVMALAIPVGVSFYTFQTMSYTIDVYRRDVRAERNGLNFALFASFFPQLCAGPIERAGRLLPQIEHQRRFSVDQTTRGAFLILLGLFKKVVIADGIAPLVAGVYGAPGPASAADILLATYAFALQIYGDFAGYTDIARGIAKIFGIELSRNFSTPYFATNPSDFWRRWHISLSTWLRDYLYIPLGGNRTGRWQTYRNLMLTMMLGGLWHGAAWNFVLWGVFHGLILCAHRAVSQEGTRLPRTGWAREAARVLLFFHVTCYGWLLFRAESLSQIADFSWRILTWEGTGVHIGRPALATLVGIPILLTWELLEWRAGEPQFYRTWVPSLRGAAYAVLMFVLLMGASNEPAQFIYFRF